MSIGGTKRENVEFQKFVGVFEGEVVAINPTLEQFKSILGMEIKEDSKTAEYLGKSTEGNTTLRIDAWFKPVKFDSIFKASFYLEDKIRTNKEGTKTQYINNVGVCSWAEDEKDLAEWFTKRPYREAKVGEEELYGFLRSWLSKLDYFKEDTELTLDWKQLMKGNVKTLKEQIGGEFASTVVGAAIIVTKDKEGEMKTYQGVYNKAFLPGTYIKQFRLIDYNKKSIQDLLGLKAYKDLKFHEKFVTTVSHPEHGCKDFYSLAEIKEYDPSENVVEQSATIIEEDDNSDY